MARKPLLEGSGFAGFLASEQNFIELYDAISGIGTGMPFQHVIFVGKQGDDTNPGTIIGNPKLTISAAIAAAMPGDAVWVMDAGTYNETVHCKGGVDVYAPMATLEGSVYFAEAESIVFRNIIAPSGATAIQKPGGATDGDCYAIVDHLSLDGNSNGVVCYDGGSTIHCRVGLINVNFGSALGSLAQNVGSLQAVVGRVLIDGAGVAVSHNGPAAIVGGSIGEIVKDPTATNTTAFYCLAGEISLFVGGVDVDTERMGNGAINITMPGGTIDGGQIDNTPIGLRTPASGAFTTLRSTLMAAGAVVSDANGNMTSETALPIIHGGTGQTTAADAFGAIKQTATETYAGVAEVATTDEVSEGTANDLMVTPLGLGSFLRAVPAYTGTDSIAAISAPHDGQRAMVVNGHMAMFVFNSNATVPEVLPWFILPADGTPGVWELFVPREAGYARRATFGPVDDTHVSITGPGEYDMRKAADSNAVITAMIVTDITNFELKTRADDEWTYIYIDRAKLDTKQSGYVTDDDLFASVSEPVFDSARLGWYDGDNRCIGAIYTDGDQKVIPFAHHDDLMMLQVLHNFHSHSHGSWTAIDIKIPAFSREAYIATSNSTAHYRLHADDTLGYRMNNGIYRFPTDDNRQIEGQDTAGNVIKLYLGGYYFGKGM